MPADTGRRAVVLDIGVFYAGLESRVMPNRGAGAIPVQSALDERPLTGTSQAARWVWAGSGLWML